MSKQHLYSRSGLFEIRDGMPRKEEPLAWRRPSDADPPNSVGELDGSELPVTILQVDAPEQWVYRTAGSNDVSAPMHWSEIQTLIDEQLVERAEVEVRRVSESAFMSYNAALAARNSRLAPQPVSLDDIASLSYNSPTLEKPNSKPSFERKPSGQLMAPEPLLPSPPPEPIDDALGTKPKKSEKPKGKRVEMAPPTIASPKKPSAWGGKGTMGAQAPQVDLVDLIRKEKGEGAPSKEKKTPIVPAGKPAYTPDSEAFPSLDAVTSSSSSTAQSKRSRGK